MYINGAPFFYPANPGLANPALANPNAANAANPALASFMLFPILPHVGHYLGIPIVRNMSSTLTVKSKLLEQKTREVNVALLLLIP